MLDQIDEVTTVSICFMFDKTVVRPSVSFAIVYKHLTETVPGILIRLGQQAVGTGEQQEKHNHRHANE